MSRLIDQIHRRGLARNIDLAELVRHDLTVLDRAPVVSVDQATRYFFEICNKEDIDSPADIPNLAPPFTEAFVETRRPRMWLDSCGNEVMDPQKIMPRHWGALVVSEDLKKTHQPDYGDRWPEKAARTVGHMLSSGEPGAQAYQHSNERGRPRYYPEPDVRFLVSLTLYLDWQNVRTNCVQGPMVHVLMAVKENGDPATYRRGSRHAGERIMQFRPIVDAGKMPEAAAAVGEHGMLLVTPLLFGMSLMHYHRASVSEVDPTNTSASRRSERNHGRPLSKHHVLNVEPINEALNLRSRAREVGIKRALHEVRGHFKYYTPERPLFGGTYHGWVWCPNHTRGDPSAGRVDKDYRVHEPVSRPEWLSAPQSSKQAEHQTKTKGESSLLTRLRRRFHKLGK